MKQLHLSDSGALAAACEVLRGPRPVFMLELPSVFALVAPPSLVGARALDETKRRLPGKTYGSLIGDMAAFRALTPDSELPEGLRGPGALKVFSGAFMRVVIGPPEARTAAVARGTHQGLLLDGPHRALFIALEEYLRAQAEPALFCGGTYSSPLGTSANWSGDPLGSITTWERALEFARDRELPLVLRCDPESGAAGSFPIFRLGSGGVTLEREGPDQALIRARIDAALTGP